MIIRHDGVQCACIEHSASRLKLVLVAGEPGLWRAETADWSMEPGGIWHGRPAPAAWVMLIATSYSIKHPVLILIRITSYLLRQHGTSRLD